jgi:DNA-binding NtrC family response regulator
LLKALVVDDEESIREVLRLRLEAWGYRVRTAKDVVAARQSARSFRPDIILSDVVMPRHTGIELLQILAADSSRAVIILMTAHGTVDMAVDAMKLGARDFVTKPLDYSKLKAILEAVEEDRRLLLEAKEVDSKLKMEGRFGRFVGDSSLMKEVYELIQSTAETDASVLITGESGTGKELAALAIHEYSSRCDQVFLPLNAAAIPSELVESEVFGHEKGAFTGAVESRAGCFELANWGTLFLDEIGEMPVDLQTKLLRVIEDGRVRRLGGRQEIQVDVRLLAATNRDPVEAVRSGRLRQDLFYRINVLNIHLPALRDRQGDIRLLIEHFRQELNQKHGTSVMGVQRKARGLLERYSWPGNVRELRNTIERAAVLARDGWIQESHLPPYLTLDQEPTLSEDIEFPLGSTAAEVEKALILKTLQRTKQNKAQAARILGVDVKTIRNKLKSYGIS